jgi:hypothetical protein
MCAVAAELQGFYFAGPASNSRAVAISVARVVLGFVARTQLARRFDGVKRKDFSVITRVSSGAAEARRPFSWRQKCGIRWAARSHGTLYAQPEAFSLGARSGELALLRLRSQAASPPSLSGPPSIKRTARWFRDQEACGQILPRCEARPRNDG